MNIPASALANLGALGVLQITDDVQYSFEEGAKYGAKDQAIFFERILKREFVLVDTFHMDRKKDDEYIRGYRQALENIQNKYSLKNQC